MLYTLVYIIKSSGHANHEETAFGRQRATERNAKSFLFAFRMLYTVASFVRAVRVGRVGNVDTLVLHGMVVADMLRV